MSKKLTDLLLTHISKFVKLSARDKMLIRNNVEIIALKPGEFFHEFSEVSNHIGFITKGVLRSFYNDSNKKEITTNFFQENDFVLNFSSFYNLTPITEAIQVETDSIVIIIQRKQYNIFAERIPVWQHAISLVSNNLLLSNTNFQREVINQDTKTIYLNFIKKYPQLIKNVPLGHIASYLGMTQSTLSRVRKKIVSG